MEPTEFFIRSFTSLITVFAPFAIIPTFLTITEGYGIAERRKIVNKATLASFLICIISLLFGKYLFHILGFSINSFRVAGGTLLLIMSTNMLQAKTSNTRISDIETDEGVVKDDVSIFPLAIPILAGPATISTIILHATEAKTFANYMMLISALLLAFVVIYGLLLTAPRISKIFGRTGMNILTRIMGLVLASIAIEFIFQGIKFYFKIT